MSEAAFKCKKCPKKFKYKSHLERHTDIKIPCDQKKEDLDCKLCKVKLNNLAEQKRHNITKKHISKMGDNNIIINGDNNVVNITHIYNFPQGTRPFSETNLDVINLDIITKLLTNDVEVTNILNDFKEEIYPANSIFATIFKYFIKVFAVLNFNLAHSENNNCAIFSFFTTDTNVIKYFVLKIDNIKYTHIISEVDYLVFMGDLINLFEKINSKYQYEDFNICLNYIIRFKHILPDRYARQIIENELVNEYNKLKNKIDNKQKRDKEIEEALLSFKQETFTHTIN